MNQQTLILDLDDTLIHCNKYFKESRNRFANQMQKWFKFLTKEEIMQKQLDIDLRRVEQHGLDSTIYPESLVSTYEYFCMEYGRKMRESEIKKVRNIGLSVFQKKVQPFPKMYEILEVLQGDGHQLYLFTGGDQANQKRKINQLGLAIYFRKGIFIYEHKNTKALQSVLNKIKADKKSTWMVGNSLKTDIKPAIELGINAVHIPSDFEWSYNIIDVEIEPKGTFAQLESLHDLPAFLREQTYFNVAL